MPENVKPAARKRRQLPAWLIVTIGTVLTGAALIWSSSLYDDRGEPLLDDPVSKVLVALLGAVGIVLSLLLQRSHAVEHELKPNSGKSMRDAVDRIEKDAREARLIAARAEEKADRNADDLGELREDVQATRTEVQGTAADIRFIREHITKE